jgi:hypothetical protein
VTSGDRGTRRTVAARWAALLTVVGCCGVPTFAQGRGGFQPIFAGGTPIDPLARRALTTSVTVNEGYDEDLAADAGATPTPGTTQTSGTYSSLTPVVSFTARARRIGFSLGGTSNVRHYAQTGRTAAVNHDVAGGFLADIGRTTTVVANQAVSYSPSYLYALFGETPGAPTPGEPIAGAPDYKTTTFRSYTYATNVALTHSLSPRAAFSVNSSLRRTDFVGNVEGVGDMQLSGAGANYRYNVSRGFVVNLGYALWQSKNSLQRSTEHDLVSGLGFTRTLSATRRSSFGFNIGPTLSQIQVPVAGRWESQPGHFRVVGDGYYEREIGRTWSARAAYRRGLSYVEAFAGPVYVDSANVGATGALNRRIDLLVSGAYVTGQMAAQNVAAARFTTYTVNGRVRVGLSRNVAAHVEGIFYDYAFDRRLILIPGIPPDYTRIGARVGLTLWTSMTSKPHAAR